MKILFSLLLLLFIPLSWAGSDSARLENVQIEIQSLSKEQKKTKASKDTLYLQLKKQSKQVSNLKKELFKLNLQLQQQAKQLKKIKQQQKQKSESHSEQQKALRKQLRAAYFNTQSNYLKILLNQDDPAKASRSKVYFHYFNEARQQLLIDIASTLKTLNNDQKKLAAAQQHHQKLYKQRQQQQKKLKQQNNIRLTTLRQLNSKLDSQGERLLALQQEEKSLQVVFASIARQKKKEAKTTTANLKSEKLIFSKNKGLLPWPIKGRVTAHYGNSRNLGKLTWQGLMIKAPVGKNVVATGSGKIVFSDWLRGFGLLLIIDHGDQYMTLYGNNQSLLKEVGDSVNANELIALSGDKGIREYVGLYFEVRYKGNPTNPQKWLGKQR